MSRFGEVMGDRRGSGRDRLYEERLHACEVRDLLLSTLDTLAVAARNMGQSDRIGELIAGRVRSRRIDGVHKLTIHAPGGAEHRFELQEDVWHIVDEAWAEWEPPAVNR